MDASEPAYRIDRALLRGDVPLLAVLLADIGVGLWAMPRLPERVPVHWNIAGEADRFGPAWENALLMPAIALVLWLVLLVLPLADPLKKNYVRFPETLKLFRWLLPLMIVAFHLVVTFGTLGKGIDSGKGVGAIVAVVFVVLGNSMGKLRHNWFIGIRTPWTLASEEVWTRTHRLAAPIWVAGGLAMLVGVFLPGGAGPFVFGAALATIIVVPVGFSFALFRRLSSAGSA